MAHRVDFEQFIEEVLDSVSDLPDDLKEALKERMHQADSTRKIDLQELLSETAHAD